MIGLLIDHKINLLLRYILQHCLYLMQEWSKPVCISSKIKEAKTKKRATRSNKMWRVMIDGPFPSAQSTAWLYIMHGWYSEKQPTLKQNCILYSLLIFGTPQDSLLLLKVGRTFLYDAWYGVWPCSGWVCSISNFYNLYLMVNTVWIYALSPLLALSENLGANYRSQF